MKTLIINAHPDYRNEEHYSIMFQKEFMKKFNEGFSSEDLTVLNLYEIEIPRIEEGQLLSIWNKEAANELLSNEEEQLKKVSEMLLSQFKEHQRIVLITPLHNFNVTSRMKDYIDNILIARETFKYTETGSVGLMTEDYRLLVIQASGSIYTKEDRYKDLDISTLYLKGIFQEIMGFKSVEILRIEGTAVLAKDVIVSDNLKKLDLMMNSFYA
ncbi:MULTISPECIES: NAD(P)H-dependent oxidoreductase [Vagococcus]|uniref:FMN dependent NADH:quinone oxidoreductase n=1 Tax=Vagococcus fluvialis bH819 TaxID=1255619 RepID=A0A1X6WN59_9ENTE|nr:MULTISPECIES: NAD(P)H-dependent oxidoreductase [Vagococcus]SLM85662.1 FMN-dependent NADH-azoreductase [Vagococcus fluvialis bH819]HCM89628.1 FMN-dependent NADH-azoreductase [Vagococcus sp.]